MNQINELKKIYFKAGLAFLALLCSVLCSKFILKAFTPLSFYFSDQIYSWIDLFISTYIIGYPICFFIIRSIPAEYYEIPSLENVSLGFLFTALLLSAGSFFAYASATFYFLNQPAPVQSMAEAVPLILFGCILSPLIEEFVFRKLLLDRLFGLSLNHALLFSAAAFALFHLNLVQFVNSFLLGCLFGLVYQKTRRLRYPFLLHAAVNIWTTLLLPALKSQIPYLPHKRILYIALAAFCLLTGLYGLIKYYKRNPGGENTSRFHTPFLTLPFILYISACFLIMLIS